MAMDAVTGYPDAPRGSHAYIHHAVRESLRRLRELYGLDEATPIFGMLRKLQALDIASLPLLAVQVVWARDPLFRSIFRPCITPGRVRSLPAV